MFRPVRATPRYCSAPCANAGRSETLRAKVAAGTFKVALRDEAKREAIAAALANPAFWRPSISEIAGHVGVSTRLVRAVYREKGLMAHGFIATLTAARFDAMFADKVA